MSHPLPEISADLADWIERQPVFFVATAPLAAEGRVNLSPKGGDALRVLGPMEVAWLDYTGSGAETAAHLRENGRICVMLCAFEGQPRIVRLHGTGELLMPDDPDDTRYAALSTRFPAHPGARCIVRVVVQRVSSSCGFSVPYMDFVAPRRILDDWSAKQGPEGLAAYRKKKNRKSIDGLPALPIPDPQLDLFPPDAE